MKRPTIKDVASAAGVSASAVSRSFSNGPVAEETRSRVLAAADTLGFRPSLVARRLVTRRSDTVTLVTGRMRDPFDTEFLERLAEGFSDRQIRLVVAPASKQASASGGIYQAMDDRSDAVVIAAGTMSLDASDACVRAGMPVFLAGRIVDAPGIEGVVAQNADGGRQAAELLMRTGCTRLAYLGLSDPTFSDRERGEGFRDSVRAAGQTPALLRLEEREDEALVEAMIAVLARADRPDGLFAANDRLALRAVDAAQALGLSIPDDLSVIGFNNGQASRTRSYRLTTLDYPCERVVNELLDLFDRRMANPDAPREQRRIPVRLVLRDTTRRQVLALPPRRT